MDNVTSSALSLKMAHLRNQVEWRYITKYQTLTDWFGVWVIGAFVFGVVGPFQTGMLLPLWQSMALWVGLVAVGCLFHIAVIVMMLRLEQLRLYSIILFGSTTFAAIYLPIMCFVIELIPEAKPINRGLAYISIFTVSVAIYLILDLLESLRREPPKAHHIIPPAEYFDTGDLLHVEWFHGRVLLHSLLGSELVEGDFATFLDSFQFIDGLRVHRNHWVAREGVLEMFSRDGELYVAMRDGSHVPVGEIYMKAVRTTFAHLEEKQLDVAWSAV